ncbi:M56 family metallopeptidase [Myxococcota bacterium]|nr:M56 family metallopeptidase [Myxococcota bacterium]
MNGLTALVLFALLFLVLNGAWSVLIQQAARPLYRARLLRLAPARRAAWSAALLALPPALALAVVLPVVIGSAAGWIPVIEWCHRIHTHCDLLLGSDSATEVLVYGLTGGALAVALGVVFARLGAPLLWARRRASVTLAPADRACLDRALARFEARGEAPPRVVVIPSLGGGAAVFGIRRPTVMLSADLLGMLGPDELYAVLRHERAHFERRDGLWSLGITLGRHLSPWPGAGRALATLWHLDREILCDGQAVRDGADPLALAQSLVTAARLPRRLPPWWAPALVDGAGFALSERVQRLLADRQTGESDAPTVLAVCAALVLAAAACSAFAGEALLSLHCLVEEGVHLLS